MAVIVERLFTGTYGGTRRGIELFNEELVRPLPFGNNWTKLRLGLLWGLGTNSAVNFPGIVDVGACSASGRGVLSGVPVNYVGTGYGGGNTRAAAGLINVTTSSGYSTATGAWHFYAQHGGADDFYSRDNVGTHYAGGCSLAQNGFYRRQYTLVDIQKVSSIRCDVCMHGTTLAGIGNGNDNGGRSLMDALEGSPFGASTAYIPAYSLATGLINYTDSGATAFTAVTWQESAGPLDALNIAWNVKVFGLTIYEMAVGKYA